MWRERERERERVRLKNKVIQREEFNVKESQCYNVSVLMNHHQDLERMISSDVRSPMDYLTLLKIFLSKSQ